MQPELVYKKLVKGLSDFFTNAGYEKAYIGLSGGIDSTVAACIAKQALGKNNVTGISMPSRLSSNESVSDAYRLAENLGIKIIKVPIDPIFSAYRVSFSEHFRNLPEDHTEENIQARIRANILMAMANKFNALVINTGNRTEAALGYATLYGDMCGAVALLGEVNKLMIYRIAEYINRDKEIIPRSIIEKKPSAELSAGQTDESSLGAGYDILAPMVDDIEDGRSFDELKARYSEDILRKTIERIERNRFKRRQMPPGIRIT